MGVYDGVFNLFGVKPLGQIIGATAVGAVAGVFLARKLDPEMRTVMMPVLGGAAVGFVAGLLLAFNDVRQAAVQRRIATGQPPPSAGKQAGQAVIIGAVLVGLVILLAYVAITIARNS